MLGFVVLLALVEDTRAGRSYEVLHYTRLLAQRIGRIGWVRELNLRVTFHDPCYLGGNVFVAWLGWYCCPARLLSAVARIALRFPRRASTPPLRDGVAGRAACGRQPAGHARVHAGGRSDASNANYSSTMVAEAPAVKIFEPAPAPDAHRQRGVAASRSAERGVRGPMALAFVAPFVYVYLMW